MWRGIASANGRDIYKTGEMLDREVLAIFGDVKHVPGCGETYWAGRGEVHLSGDSRTIFRVTIRTCEAYSTVRMCMRFDYSAL